MEQPYSKPVSVRFKKENWEGIINILDSSSIKNNELLEWGNLVKQKIQASFDQGFSSGKTYVSLSKDDWVTINKVIDSEINNRSKDWADWARFIINQINTEIMETERKSSINDLIEKKKLVTRQISEMSSDYRGDLISQISKKQMILEVDFYSKEKVSIQMYFDPTIIDEKSELFLFACFALRHFSNIGHNMVGEAFAGLFLKAAKIDETFEEWDGVDYFGNPNRYKADDLLLETLKFRLQISGLDEQEIRQRRSSMYIDLQGNLHVKTLDEGYFQKLPELTNYNGQGNKQFTMTWPPLILEWKGFKKITLDWGYYGFHALVAFYRVLANRHWEDTDYRINLKMIAFECAGLYLLDKIPRDQAECAKGILARISS